MITVASFKKSHMQIEIFDSHFKSTFKGNRTSCIFPLSKKEGDWPNKNFSNMFYLCLITGFIIDVKVLDFNLFRQQQHILGYFLAQKKVKFLASRQHLSNIWNFSAVTSKFRPNDVFIFKTWLDQSWFLLQCKRIPQIFTQ